MVQTALVTGIPRLERVISRNGTFYLCIEAAKLGKDSPECDDILRDKPTPKETPDAR